MKAVKERSFCNVSREVSRVLNEGATTGELNTGIVLISCSSLASELVWVYIVQNLLGGNLFGRFIARPTVPSPTTGIKEIQNNVLILSPFMYRNSANISNKFCSGYY